MLTLREEILNLLESPELLEYLLSNPERLCEFDYANIIAGAPIGLAEKRALLEKLKNSAELRREPDKVADYIAALDSAMAALENSGNETVLSVVLRRCGVDSFVDGAYYAASAESARRAIREYVSECSDCDWGHMYWEMKLHRRAADLCGRSIFISPSRMGRFSIFCTITAVAEKLNIILGRRRRSGRDRRI